MDAEYLDSLKKRFGFETWADESARGRDLVRRKVVLPRDLLGDLEPGEFRDIDPGDGTRIRRALWSDPQQESAVLSVEVRECEDMNRAHEVVLELVAHVEAPDIRKDRGDVGDVSFGRGDSNFRIFSRGNLAVIIRNAGSQIVPVDRFAEMVDRWILGD